MKKLLCVLLFTPIAATAWDGFDWKRGTYIEIGKGETVRRGREVEVFDYKTGQYRQMEVESIRRTPGGKVELEVRDAQTGQPHTFDMDRD